jgi:dienelactone hydrolase
VHWVDRLTGRVLARSKMFGGGFGDVEALLAMQADAQLFEGAPRVPLAEALACARPQRLETKAGLICARDIAWDSAAILPRFEASVRRAHARWLSSERGIDAHAPLCLVMAASGEEGYDRRTRVLAPLVRAGLEVLILENPFYGLRRRPAQSSARLPTVHEQFHMNHASVMEALGLLAALRALPGFERKRLGLLGYSMGGYMVSLAAGAFGAPLAVVPVAAGRCPRSVYLDGALSWAVDFDALTRERDDARELLAHLFESTARHLRAPAEGSSIIMAAAERDGFVLPHETRALLHHWPGASLRLYRGGHTHVFTTFDRHVRRAVKDAFRGLG